MFPRQFQTGILIALAVIPSFLFAEPAHTPRLAIMNFSAGHGTDQATAELAAGFVRSTLVRSRLFTVVEREKVDEVFKEQALQQSGCTDEKCAVKIGKILAAEKILSGSTIRTGARIHVLVQIVDVSTGSVDFSRLSEGADLDGLESDCSALTRVLLRTVAGSEGAAAKYTWPSMLWRALLFPGLAHLSNEQYTAGVLYSLSFVVLAGVYAKAERDVVDSGGAGSDAASEVVKQRTGVAVAIGCLYIGQVIHAVASGASLSTAVQSRPDQKWNIALERSREGGPHRKGTWTGVRVSFAF